MNEEWIVTASHCLHRMSFVMITLGDLLRTEEEVGEINLLSKEFFTHPNYNPVTMENDIALVRLPKSIRFTNRIKPICLADEPPVIGKECFIAGWGTFVWLAGFVDQPKSRHPKQHGKHAPTGVKIPI